MNLEHPECRAQVKHDFFNNLQNLSLLQPDPVIIHNISDTLALLPVYGFKLVELCRDQNGALLHLDFHQVGSDAFARYEGRVYDDDPHRRMAKCTLRDITFHGVDSPLTVLPIGYVVGKEDAAFTKWVVVLGHDKGIRWIGAGWPKMKVMRS